MNLPPTFITSLVMVLYSFGMIASYPLGILPVFEIFEKTRFYTRLPTPRSFPGFRRLYSRTTLVALTAVGAMGVPKLSLFLNFIGAFACTAIVFVIPIVLYNKLFWAELSTFRKYMHAFIVVFGICCGAVSATISLLAIIKAFGENSN